MVGIEPVRNFFRDREYALSPLIDVAFSTGHAAGAITDYTAGNRVGALMHVQKSVAFGSAAVIPYLLSKNNLRAQNIYSFLVNGILDIYEGQIFAAGTLAMIANYFEPYFRMDKKGKGDETDTLHVPPYHISRGSKHTLSDAVIFAKDFVEANHDIKNTPKGHFEKMII